MSFLETMRSVWTPSQRAGVALFAASLLGAALAVGTVHAQVLCIVCVGFAASCFLFWRDAEPMRPRRSATVLVIVAAGLVVYTALQALPLPASVIGLVSPRTADVWAHVLSPLREGGPSWHPLSLDPIATRIEALRGIVYLLAFLTAVRIAARREGIEVLCALLVGCALVVSVVALLHPAFGAQRVFGIYKPETVVDARHISPLLNPNPLAAYINVGICVSLAAAMTPRARVPRVIPAALVILFVATQLWVASRGGLVALALGVILVIVMMRAAAPRHPHFKSTSVVAAVLVFAGLGMTVLASSKDAWQELAGTDVSKLTMQKQMLPFVWAHKWLGVGRGAFESSFPAFRTSPGHMLFTHPEHVLVQWASEWGLPIAIAACAGIAWALRPQSVVARSHLVIGPWAALAAALVHNLVDLNSEVPGVMLLFVTCAAIVVAGSSGDRAHDRWAARPRALAVGSVALAIAGLVILVPTLGHDLYTDRRDAHDAATVREDPDPQRFDALLREAMLRHPAEPYLPYMGALRASRFVGLNALPWAARTIECAPIYGPVHMILGRVFRRIDAPAQARLEYRTAIEQAPELASYVLKDAASLVGGYDDALDLVPYVDGDRVLAPLAAAVAQRLPATRALLDAELLRRDPGVIVALTRTARIGVTTVEQHEPWCEPDGTACLEDALKGAKDFSTRQPSRCEGYALRARARAGSGNYGAGADDSAAAIDRLEDPNICLRALLSIAQEGKLEVRMTDAIDRLVRAPCSSEEECLANLHLGGDAEFASSHYTRAMAFYRKAYDRYPDSHPSLDRIARTASRMGLHAEALDAYTRLAKRVPDEPHYAEAAARERQAMGSSGR